jgi:N-methylhydantoinase A
VAKQIAVDVGGTFTDVVIRDDNGGVVVAKGPTVPDSPELGILELIDRELSMADLAQTEYFLHGTTVGLNALLQHEGVAVGLVATEGFRDVLEIRRGDRGDPYDLFWTPAPPLVPRYLRLPVRERILADGTVLRPLALDDVDEIYKVFVEHAVESIAVALMNAYVDPAHEEMVRDRLRDLGFEGAISLSHQVSREYREYERTSTTVIDAYVSSRVKRYLGELEGGLAARGFSGTALVTRCGGGALSFEEARMRPFETIISGPVAGVTGAARLARAHGFSRAVSADVGGTSFDTCLIVDGSPTRKYQGVVEGMPVMTEWVDVRSIGAGGGSIAYNDEGGLLRVGPRSAGADPGPACYGRGGVQPTTTDAAVALGLVGAARLADQLQLDADRAEKALELVTGGGVISTKDAARGILEVSTAAMAGAIREITVEQGEDPRQAVLVAFGGAGPAFATMLAADLDIEAILIPAHAGNFSACGLLVSDLAQSAAQTRIVRLGPGTVPVVQEVVANLVVELEGRAGSAVGAASYRAAADIRYVGQEHTLTIPIALDGTIVTMGADDLRSAFLSAYQDVFGMILPETDVELVTVRASRIVKRLAELPPDAGQGEPRVGGSHPAWSFTAGSWLEFAERERSRLRVGDVVSGPAIIFELTATTYVDQGFRAEVCADTALLLTRSGAA